MSDTNELARLRAEVARLREALHRVEKRASKAVVAYSTRGHHCDWRAAVDSVAQMARNSLSALAQPAAEQPFDGIEQLKRLREALLAVQVELEDVRWDDVRGLFGCDEDAHAEACKRAWKARRYAGETIRAALAQPAAEPAPTRAERYAELRRLISEWRKQTGEALEIEPVACREPVADRERLARALSLSAKTREWWMANISPEDSGTVLALADAIIAAMAAECGGGS